MEPRYLNLDEMDIVSSSDDSSKPNEGVVDGFFDFDQYYSGQSQPASSTFPCVVEEESSSDAVLNPAAIPLAPQLSYGVVEQHGSPKKGESKEPRSFSSSSSTHQIQESLGAPKSPSSSVLADDPAVKLFKIIIKEGDESKEDIDEVTALLAQYPKLGNVRLPVGTKVPTTAGESYNAESSTLLMLACSQPGKIEIACALIDSKADPRLCIDSETRKDENGWPALLCLLKGANKGFEIRKILRKLHECHPKLLSQKIGSPEAYKDVTPLELILKSADVDYAIVLGLFLTTEKLKIDPRDQKERGYEIRVPDLGNQFYLTQMVSLYRRLKEKVDVTEDNFLDLQDLSEGLGVSWKAVEDIANHMGTEEPSSEEDEDTESEDDLDSDPTYKDELSKKRERGEKRKRGEDEEDPDAPRNQKRPRMKY